MKVGRQAEMAELVTHRSASFRPEPMIPLALLVILKVGLDVAAHVKEHTGQGGLFVLRRRT